MRSFTAKNKKNPEKSFLQQKPIKNLRLRKFEKINKTLLRKTRTAQKIKERENLANGCEKRERERESK